VLISYSWLTSLMDLPGPAPTPAELAKLLTGLGLEVEGVHAKGSGLEAIVVGEVRGVQPHPQSDKLSLVELFDGQQTLAVVCGAANIRGAVGGKVAFAPIGARLPGGLEIAAREVRGVASHGMICSETELDIGGDGDGILILPNDLAAGASLPAVVPGVVDTILELGVTPNRSDALGHVGVARDVATKLRGKLRLPALRPSAAPDDPALVTIAAPARCGRYFGFALQDVRVGSSPLWLRVRLHRLGLRPISNVVDITNFVLLEFGQPLHAFDRSKLAEGRVVVRLVHGPEALAARSMLADVGGATEAAASATGESLTTLDGTARALDPRDLVIADARDAQALAGVMGGARSMVGADTREVLLEAAWFAPAGVRASAKRHGLATDASYRFERGVDHGRGLERAALRALNLLEELAGGVCVAQHEAVGERPGTPSIPLRRARIERLLGVAVPADEVAQILEGLEIEPERPLDWPPEAGPVRTLVSSVKAVLQSFVTDAAPEPDCLWRPPTHRPDLQLEVDLIEEVMRHHGLEHVPARAIVPREPRAAAAPDPTSARIDRLADGLREAGLREIVSLAFVAEDKLRPFEHAVPAARFVRVANPMRGAGVMRTHMLPGLLDALAHNTTRHGRPVRLFEIGRVYAWPEGQVDPEQFPAGTRAVDVQLPQERTIAGLLLHAGSKGEVDPRALTGAVAQALGRFGLRLHLSQGPGVPWLHPGVQVRLAVETGEDSGGPRLIGVAGELHPDLVAAWGLPEGSRPVHAEIDVDALPTAEVAVAREIPRFPATSRDLSLEIPLGLPAADVVAALREAAAARADLAGAADPPRLHGLGVGASDGGHGGVEVLEDYRGAGVPPGHRALLLRLHYAAAARSVTDAEVQALHAAIVEHACGRLRAFAATVRPR